MEPTRECSLGSTTSVWLTPSAPGGHCSASAVPVSKTRMVHAAMVLRMIPFKPRLGRAWLDVRMQHKRPLGVSAEFRGDSSVAGQRPVASLPRIDCRVCALPLVQVATINNTRCNYPRRLSREASSNGLGGGNGGLFRDARCLAVPRANSLGAGHIFGGRLTQPIQVLR